MAASGTGIRKDLYRIGRYNFGELCFVAPKFVSFHFSAVDFLAKLFGILRGVGGNRSNHCFHLNVLIGSKR